MVNGRSGFLAKRGFSFDMLCLVETDDVAAGFYLDACIQGKSCGHNIKRRSRQHGKRVLFVFFEIHPTWFLFLKTPDLDILRAS